MSISISRYVEIFSGINTTKTAREKDMIARLFTTNSKVPVDGIVEFSNLASVSGFFGSDSQEYAVARIYFNFTSKYQTRPKKISFARNFLGGATAFVEGTIKPELSDIQGIVSGDFEITINGAKKSLTELNFSDAVSFENVAETLQSKIREAGDDAEFTNLTVEYTSDETFKITAGSQGDFSIVISDSPLARVLGLESSQNPINSKGAKTNATITDVLNKSYESSNNFATFAFIDELDNTTVAEIAKWNKDIRYTEFMFVAKVYKDTAYELQALVSTMNGTSLELCDYADGKYNYIIPMAIAATTNYDKENGIQNYMYQQIDDVGVVVTSDDDANTYDNLKVNYYGQTQQAGQKLAFYQCGVLQGDYQDQNIYLNEIWLKEALTVTYLNYMLLTPNWYANKAGKAIGQTLAQEVIDRAKTNGTITTEKEITKDDKVFILNITSDENAWRQIYQEGFYLMTSISQKVIEGQNKYVFNYTLLYSKGDSIKKVEGNDILI